MAVRLYLRGNMAERESVSAKLIRTYWDSLKLSLSLKPLVIIAHHNVLRIVDA
jgi:hypothetical protein